ncbi:Nickel and cobalt resistance protein CnrA [Dickeya dianthicola]|nr:Cation efflux system protein [Dickeya dianthicola RNS04.9]AYC17804.1 Nickel and cobalt resistance protein CnrA [Dickeya dianthicola]
MSSTVMVFLTAPLGLIGVVPTLLLFNQPFGINALVGLIALSGILMRNTLILRGQIHHNEQEGLAPFHAVVEATVQLFRPVLLTAMAAILAFIPLTHSVFWGTLAYTLIGGTIITLVMPSGSGYGLTISRMKGRHQRKPVRSGGGLNINELKIPCPARLRGQGIIGVLSDVRDLRQDLQPIDSWFSQASQAFVGTSQRPG